MLDFICRVYWKLHGPWKFTTFNSSSQNLHDCRQWKWNAVVDPPVIFSVAPEDLQTDFVVAGRRFVAAVIIIIDIVICVFSSLWNLRRRLPVFWCLSILFTFVRSFIMQRDPAPLLSCHHDRLPLCVCVCESNVRFSGSQPLSQPLSSVFPVVC